MKQILALMLTALLLCTVIMPSVLAAEESAALSETVTMDTMTGDTGSTDSAPSGTTAPSDTAAEAEEETTDTDNSTITDGSESLTVLNDLGDTGSDPSYPAPVLTVTPSAITLTSFEEPDRTDAVAFAAGTSQEEISKWFDDSVAGFIGYDADGNSYDLVSGAWSLDAVDTITAGVYYAFTSPDLGTEYTLADGVSLPRQLCAVSIQVPGEPDINCCVAGRGFLHFPWVLSSTQEEQLDEFAVWLRQDGGEWTSLSDGFSFVSDGLRLSQRIFTNGSTYELKVTYPGGQTGVLTFQYDGELSILDYSGGDRDGGDAGGDDSGTGSQPAPDTPQPEPTTPLPEPTTPQPEPTAPLPEPNTPQPEPTTPLPEPNTPQPEPTTPLPTPTTPQSSDNTQKSGTHNSNNTSSVQAPVAKKEATGTPAAPTEEAVPVYSDAVLFDEAAEASPIPEKNTQAQASAAVMESYSPTQTVISALRLRDLCAEGESVVFGSGNLTVSIPSSLLLALNLSDTDTLTVTLTQPEGNRILLAVEISGKLVTTLPGTVLRLRYTPLSEDAEFTVQNEAGEPVMEVSYHDGLLCFTVEETGTYTISEDSGVGETQRRISLLFPISGGLLLAVGGITMFWRKRHG